ncbi:MAG: DUF2922 domain-containing protein [Clostridium sp.]|uniref:DUF2922 domain-containing protein n=1 Tax=Clostridium sp. TaxID=1506 RepID=UPI003EE456E8
MEKKYVLKMAFKNEEGKQTTITLKNIKENLDSEAVEAAMDAIVAQNIFSSAGGNLVEKIDAEIVETTVTPVQ